MSSKDNTTSFPELIKLKRDGDQLSRAEMSTFVQGVTSGAIQESQIGKSMITNSVYSLQVEFFKNNCAAPAQGLC